MITRETMDATRAAMIGGIAFTVILVGAVLWDEIAPPPIADDAQEIADTFAA